MFELILLAPVDEVETVSDALDALDALSVSVEDADAHMPAEQALFGEPGMPPPKAGWERSRVVALFATEALARDAGKLLAAQDFFAGCRLVAIQSVPEQDWVRLTQSQFTPVEITPEFWIVPSWHEPPTQATKIIRLDPGLAFGTGTHPTTRMCLRWIERHGTTTGMAWPRALDYGCGSGVLAIAAAIFGAEAIDAVDIDPAAVEATAANAQANGVAVRCALPDDAVGPYELIVANILAAPLTLLAPLLGRRLADGGSLVLSGILVRQADELRDAYRPWIDLDVDAEDDGWALMTGTSRPGSHGMISR